MKSYLLLLIAVFGLAACESTPPLPLEQGIAGFSLTSTAPKDRVRETTTETIVRAYQAAKTEDGKDTLVEIKGAKCSLTSDHISATIITPQKVAVPKYDQIAALGDRGVPPSILVSCRANDLSGSALLAAKPGTVTAGNSGNLVVDLVILAGTAAAAASVDWRFQPAVAVTVQ